MSQLGAVGMLNTVDPLALVSNYCIIILSCLFLVDSSSQSLSAGPPIMSLPVGFDHLPEAQRELEEEERWQREQEEREEQELRQQQAQELSEWMSRPSVPPQPPPPEVQVCMCIVHVHVRACICVYMYVTCTM